MDTSRLGLFDEIDLPDKLPPQDAAVEVRLKIGKASDCLTRALDGLAHQDARFIDWSYVCKQFAGAIAAAIEGGIQADMQTPSPTNWEEDTPAVPAPNGQLFPPRHHGPYRNGGGA